MIAGSASGAPDEARDRMEREVDALYAVPLGDFVAARKRLADALKQAGEARLSKAVKALVKPTLSAWLTNETVRRSPDLVKQLLTATQAVAVAQRAPRGPTGSDASPMQTALAEQRRTIAALGVVALELASKTVGQAARDATLERVGKNLRWAAISPEEAVRTSFERGRLLRDVPAPGFAAVLGSDSGVMAPPGAESPHPPPPGPTSSGRSKGASLGGVPHQTLEERRRRQQEQARAAAEGERERVQRHQRVKALGSELRHAGELKARASLSVERADEVRTERAARVAEAQEKLEIARAELATAEAAHQKAVAILGERDQAESEIRHRLTKETGEGIDI